MFWFRLFSSTTRSGQIAFISVFFFLYLGPVFDQVQQGVENLRSQRHNLTVGAQQQALGWIYAKGSELIHLRCRLSENFRKFHTILNTFASSG